MRILYFSQYFPPEIGATQTRAYEMARNLVNMGHHVTMISEVPNHPKGIILSDYRGVVYQRRVLDGIDVIRVWVKTTPVKNFRSRIIFYTSYMVNAFAVSLLLARGRYDLIYATSPPLFVGGAALSTNFFKRIPFVFEVRDLWPESAVALGELSNPRYISWANSLENSCYRGARKIVVVTKGIYKRLVERGIHANKLALIPNGANTTLFQFRPDSRLRLREELHLTDKFVAIYAGIFGIAQGLETVVEAAKILRDNTDVQFVMVGEGPTKELILNLIHRYQLNNILVLPEQPRDVIPDYLSTSDVALIPLRKMDLFKGALPSKIFDAWACERPILLSIDGEAHQVMEQAKGGMYAPPEDPVRMAESILSLKNARRSRDEMGKSGREYTVEHHSRKSMAKKLEAVLLESL
jgi:glycosyltransferase involved in cell wall biosynthesis